MGWTRPIFGIRISPILTMGDGAVSLTGGGTGRVRGAGAAGTAGCVTTLVGGTGRVLKGAVVVGGSTGRAAANASAEFVGLADTAIAIRLPTATRGRITRTDA